MCIKAGGSLGCAWAGLLPWVGVGGSQAGQEALSSYPSTQVQ